MVVVDVGGTAVTAVLVERGVGAVGSDDVGVVVAVREQVTRLAARFDPDGLTAGQAVFVVEQLAVVRNAVATLSALAARRVADTGGWRASASSAESWFAQRAGTTASQAREDLATAQRLASLPEVAAAARSGALSPQQAAAVAGAAAVAPHKQVELLQTAAVEPLGVLREQCQAAKAAADPDPAATWARQRAARTLVRGVDGEGMATLFWRTTVDDRARFDAAIDPIVDELFTAARRAGRRERRELYAADAMVELARRATAAGRSGAGNDLGATDRGGAAACQQPTDGRQRPPDEAPPTDRRRPADGRRSAERFLSLVRVDATALARGHVVEGEVCEIAGLGPVPVQVARELLGESVLKLVITRGTDVVNTTSLGRGPTAAMKIAALWQQPRCLVRGCPNRARLEYDHHLPVAAGGLTRADNFNRLCHQHHDRKTRHGWDLVPGTGRRPMAAPNDSRHPRHKPP